MFLGGTKIDLKFEIDDPAEYYTNGDVISGTFVVTADSFTALNIEVHLRCEENAIVVVNTGQATYEEKERIRYLSLRTTLFPDKSIRYSDDSEPNARYTLKAGTYRYPFQFEIPSNDCYPETMKLSHTNAGFKWYLKGVIHRGKKLAMDARIWYDFEMRRSAVLDYVPSVKDTHAESSKLRAYLPGYAADHKTASGLLKGLVPGNSQFKKQGEATLYVTIPRDGLRQDPAFIDMDVDISTTIDDLLIVKSFGIKLKRKTFINVKGVQDKHRDVVPVLSMKDIDLPVKNGLECIRNALSRTMIKGRIAGSMDNQRFVNTYKVVVTIKLASKEKPKSCESIRISIPFNLHPYTTLNQELEGLPIYNASVGEGEAIVARTSLTGEYKDAMETRSRY